MGHTEHKLIVLRSSTEQAFTDHSLMQKRLKYYFNVIKFFSLKIAFSPAIEFTYDCDFKLNAILTN